MTTIIENTLVDYELDISELTEASLEGKGVFDVLLQTLRLHLDREFSSNRITGTAYATVYSEAITAFLQQSVQFCMSKAKLALELQQMQEQVKLLQLQQDQTIAQTNKIVTDTAVAIKQGHLIDAQTCEVKARTNQINAEVATKLPKEVELLIKQTDLLEYELTELKPQQLALSIQEVALKGRQTDIAEAEVAIKEKQLDIAEYELDHKLPAEVESITQQAALYEQKVVTESAQATTTPAAGSVMGVQNTLMNAQKDSYTRDAEQKAAKMMIDEWAVRHNADPDAAANDADSTNKLSNPFVGQAVGKMLAGIGV